MMDTSIDGVNLTDKHVVLKERVMRQEYRDVSWRVVRATGGFGCSPEAIGRAVFAEHVRDGEQARWHRDDIERLATPDEITAAVAFREGETS